MSFSFDTFVSDVRNAVGKDNSIDAIHDLLSKVVSTPQSIVDVTPIDGEDEVMLYEDDTVSIWRCRFQPDILMPPHEHLLDVFIAGYDGGEKNIMFSRRDEKLEHTATHIVRIGEVLALQKDDIHAVTAEGPAPSQALHVYLGPLSKLKRSLFDWSNGEIIQFSQENFNAMKRKASELEHRY